MFDPGELEQIARAAGAPDARVVTEELSAAMLGWPVRTFEAAVPPGKLGFRWAMFAYRTWQRLSWVDRNVLSRVVPREWFYNALITGTKPAADADVVLPIRCGPSTGQDRQVSNTSALPAPSDIALRPGMPSADDMQRPVEPLWRGMLVYRVLTLLSVRGGAGVVAGRLRLEARRARRARRDGRVDGGVRLLLPRRRAARPAARWRSPTSWSPSR